MTLQGTNCGVLGFTGLLNFAVFSSEHHSANVSVLAFGDLVSSVYFFLSVYRLQVYFELIMLTICRMPTWFRQIESIRGPHDKMKSHLPTRERKE